MALHVSAPGMGGLHHAPQTGRQAGGMRSMPAEPLSGPALHRAWPLLWAKHIDRVAATSLRVRA